MRFLIAWEMGEHLGHIALVSEVAKSLLEKGHQVVLVLKDLNSLAQLKTLSLEIYHPSLTVISAPNLANNLIKKNPASSLIEVLANRGYDSAIMLEGLVKQWIEVFQQSQIEAFLFNFAPTALLAAKLKNQMQDKETPIFLLGTGFAELNHKLNISQTGIGGRYNSDRIQQIESDIVSTINQLAAQLGYRPIQRYLDLYNVTHSFLVTYPEFDRVSRLDTSHTYINPIPSTGTESCPVWTKNGKAKIFAYLKPVDNRIFRWIKALALSGYDVCLFCPGLKENDRIRLSTANLSIVSEPVNLRSTLKDVKAVVHNGGNGLMNQAIQQGKPMLIVPTQMEQWDSAIRAEKHGVGLYLYAGDTVQTFRIKLHRIVEEPYFANNAQAIAAKNHCITQQDGVSAITRGIEQYMNLRDA